ncbi:toxin-antitoxin system YwqK family antitoxin [Ekhidna sp.]|uniref:toxin-antitoxin system YwqK family antitoxin n=1 Tax=Ekhidna sp. TaxID=2608089 RepID=UPI003CCC32A3
MIRLSVAFFIFIGLEAHSQNFPSEIDTSQYARTMGEVIGKRSEGMYRYFENGESDPFEGVLYAKYENGNYKSWQEYSAGVGQGQWINFYENGNMEEWGTYIQNKVEGPIKKYHENGQLKAEGLYREWRVRVGKWKYYDTSGKFIKAEDYGKKGDLREVEAYYESGKISKSRYEFIVDSNQKYGR